MTGINRWENWNPEDEIPSSDWDIDYTNIYSSVEERANLREEEIAEKIWKKARELLDSL